MCLTIGLWGGYRVRIETLQINGSDLQNCSYLGLLSVNNTDNTDGEKYGRILHFKSV